MSRAIDHIVLAVDNLDQAALRYESLGFKLTPRAAHNDQMGTSNRLIQFAGKNFIELLEVDRPDTLDNHAFDANPPRFSFGTHNRDFVKRRNGISMLVFASTDARADIALFQQRGIQTYGPYDFQRQATLPDGREATVAFSLGFATSPQWPELAFFVCQDRSSPDCFWQPAYQRHTNGARSIRAVYFVADDPPTQGRFLANLFESEISTMDGGIRVDCGPEQEIRVLKPEKIKAITAESLFQTNGCIAGVVLDSTQSAAEPVTLVQEYGMFIEWYAR